MKTRLETLRHQLRLVATFETLFNSDDLREKPEESPLPEKESFIELR